MPTLLGVPCYEDYGIPRRRAAGLRRRGSQRADTPVHAGAASWGSPARRTAAGWRGAIQSCSGQALIQGLYLHYHTTGQALEVRNARHTHTRSFFNSVAAVRYNFSRLSCSRYNLNAARNLTSAIASTRWRKVQCRPGVPCGWSADEVPEPPSPSQALSGGRLLPWETIKPLGGAYPLAFRASRSPSLQIYPGGAARQRRHPTTVRYHKARVVRSLLKPVGCRLRALITL